MKRFKKVMVAEDGNGNAEFRLELPSDVTERELQIAAVAGAEAFVQGRGDVMDKAKAFTIEIYEHNPTRQYEEILEMLKEALVRTEMSAAPISDSTN